MASIIAVVALGIIMFSGPLLAQRDLRDSINNIYRRTNYEDFSAKVDSAPAESVSSLGRLANVKAVEGRLSRESLATVKGKPVTLRVITVPDGGRPKVNGLLVEKGGYLKPGEASACLAEHHLSGEFGLQPGDTVTLERDGTSIPLRISGTVVSPEYLRLVGGRAQYVADPTQFGVIFVHYSEAARIFGLEGRVNEYVARVSDPAKVEWDDARGGSAARALRRGGPDRRAGRAERRRPRPRDKRHGQARDVLRGAPARGGLARDIHHDDPDSLLAAEADRLDPGASDTGGTASQRTTWDTA